MFGELTVDFGSITGAESEGFRLTLTFPAAAAVSDNAAVANANDNDLIFIILFNFRNCNPSENLEVVKKLFLFAVALAPEVCHILKSLALGLRHKRGNKPCGYDTDHTVERIGEHMAELVAHVAESHVVHRNEC